MEAHPPGVGAGRGALWYGCVVALGGRSSAAGPRRPVFGGFLEMSQGLGPRDGTSGWDPGMGPRDGTPGWDPGMGPRDGTLADFRGLSRTLADFGRPHPRLTRSSPAAHPHLTRISPAPRPVGDIQPIAPLAPLAGFRCETHTFQRLRTRNLDFGGSGLEILISGAPD